MQIADLVSTDFLSVPKNAAVSTIFPALSTAQKTAVVLSDKGRFFGTLSLFDVVKKRADVTQLHVASLCTHFPALSPVDSVSRAVELLLLSRGDLVPVVESDRVIGVVTMRAVFSQLANGPEVRGRTAQDVASFSPVRVLRSESLGHVVSLFRKSDVKKVVVVNPDQSLAGVLSYDEVLARYWNRFGASDRPFRDALHSNLPEGDRLLSVSIESEIQPVDTVFSLSSPLRDVVRHLAGPSPAAVIVANQAAVGIVTHSDVLRFVHDQSHAKVARVVYTHFPDLSEPDAARVRGLFEKTFFRMARSRPDAELHVRFKTLSEKGVKIKRQVLVHAIGSRFNLKAVDASFNPLLSAKAVCKKLEREMDRRFRK